MENKSKNKITDRVVIGRGTVRIFASETESTMNWLLSNVRASIRDGTSEHSVLYTDEFKLAPMVRTWNEVQEKINKSLNKLKTSYNYDYQELIEVYGSLERIGKYLLQRLQIEADLIQDTNPQTVEEADALDQARLDKWDEQEREAAENRKQQKLVRLARTRSIATKRLKKKTSLKNIALELDIEVSSIKHLIEDVSTYLPIVKEVVSTNFSKYLDISDRANMQDKLVKEVLSKRLLIPVETAEEIINNPTNT